MLLFLQNLRATLIPTLAVPIVLLGTFGVLNALGYNINTLTMFGMVLAIGLLVDDAIVVVENVERVMDEDELPPKEATKKSMAQITGALVGIAMVLAAVFIPMAFFSGSVGVIYRQFSITIVSAMALSVLIALIFTPALCATILKPRRRDKRRGLFGWFNRGYERTQHGYTRAVGVLVRRRWPPLLVYILMAALVALLFTRLPQGFLPDEDQGQLFVEARLPPGATQEDTRAVLTKVADHMLNEEKAAIDSVLTVVGFSFIGRGQNVGFAFVKLKDWGDRKASNLSAKNVAARLTRDLGGQLKQAAIFAFLPPSIQELGTFGGFQLQLEDRTGAGHERLMAARDQLLGAAAKDSRLRNVRPGGLDDRPEYKLDIDTLRAFAFGVSPADVNTALTATWASAYVNDFLDKDRTKRVFVQADAPFRMAPEDLGRWYVRNGAGEMVPFSAFATGRWAYGSPKLDRFNGFPMVSIQGEAAPGTSTGTALEAIGEHASALQGFAHEWYGVAYEQEQAGAGIFQLYALSLLVVFLCLAALYESWSIPVAVMLVAPLGVLGAVVASLLGGQENDVYFQVGLLAVIGLAAKNAILIVEFATDLMKQGRSSIDAALEAAHLRLRPILMTSLAFVLGVAPLAISRGAGAGAQNAIGIAIVGGVLAATFLGVLLVPVFFVMIAHRRDRAAPVAVGPHA
jgi:hydrophobe/amphiphile efflux-1 (HAE1) family protein